MQEHVAATPQYCRNCGHPVTDEFCAHCGQREGRGDLHFAEAVGDLFGDAFTWDSRLWRTLAFLLARPGYLSAEFNAGRRVRYLPAFRLYLVISFVLFLLLSLDARNAMINFDSDSPGPESAVSVAEPADVDFDPNAIPAPYREQIAQVLGEAKSQATPAGETDAPRVAEAPVPADSQAAGEGSTGTSSAPQISINIWGDDAPPWLKGFEERLNTNAKGIEDDPAAFLRDLLEYLPQMMFLMLPIFALLLKFLYLFTAFHYLQHLVFALHYHSFVYLLYIIEKSIDAVGWEIDGWLIGGFLVYLPLALRRCYHSGWFGVTLRSLVLYIGYPITLLLGFATVAMAVIAFR
jgi:hypothetical protein